MKSHKATQSEKTPIVGFDRIHCFKPIKKRILVTGGLEEKRSEEVAESGKVLRAADVPGSKWISRLAEGSGPDEEKAPE